ncbi:WD40/YVTN/BNR-like repeat-containing protein [Bacillus sp. FJAT-28004]|uniref:WD40/YVTN/BNR-like repeat-containing protein n=1 Tax=Bacillus sp. FJAT-28004 TaxID=1679165 RepID=UPI0006B5F35A|nr:sialidase family protein [Bacillus sp. FJAT-28004]
MISVKLKSGLVTAALMIGLTSAVPLTQAAGGSTAKDIFSGTPAGDTAYHFSDIQFLNGTTGRVAGNGILIGTSDAGSTWQSIYKGTWQFTQLDFISNTTGWALAKSSATGTNALIHTTDGGKSFTKIITGSLALERIHFTDAKNGFGYTRAFAYKTSNGGKTWSKISTPANTRYAEFADTKHGWTLIVVPGFGYRLSRTTDGGANWSTKLTVKSEESLGGKIYTKGSQVWAQFYGGVGMSQQSYSLYASADDGSSWRKVISQETAGGGSAPGGAAGVVKEGPASPGGHPSNMQLVDGAAILGGYSPAAEVIGVGRSIDSGKSWSNLTPIAGLENIISFTSKELGWMADTSKSNAAVYRTTDGGKSWSNKISIP